MIDVGVAQLQVHLFGQRVRKRAGGGVVVIRTLDIECGVGVIEVLPVAVADQGGLPFIIDRKLKCKTDPMTIVVPVLAVSILGVVFIAGIHKRFVLIGRGTYGLAEWGFKAGTVKDVLVDLLRSASKPLPKAELVSQVLSHRMVKENTILLNLQDSKVFKKTENGAYTLRSA